MYVNFKIFHHSFPYSPRECPAFERGCGVYMGSLASKSVPYCNKISKNILQISRNVIAAILIVSAFQQTL